MAAAPAAAHNGVVAVSLDSVVDPRNLKRMVDDGMVAVRRHPSADLTVLDYTARAQYRRVWNRETRTCRGLIVAGDPLGEGAEVRARPFEKFFSLAEHHADPSLGALPTEGPFDVFDKVDGSLGIVYEVDGGPAVATRGSFESDQARWATDHLRRHCAGWAPPSGVTVLMEIVYPANRVVVDYGGFEGLVLLASLDTATGADVAPPADWEGPVVRRISGIDDLEAAIRLAADGAAGAETEGFVIRFPPKGLGHASLRVKLKRTEYVRLHRLVTGVSTKTIWQHLAEGRGVDELVERVPDEFLQWVLTTAAGLEQRYRSIESACQAASADQRVSRSDRRATAEYFKGCAHTPVLFRMLDGKDYAPLIWRAIRPADVRPYRAEQQ